VAVLTTCGVGTIGRENSALLILTFQGFVSAKHLPTCAADILDLATFIVLIPLVEEVFFRSLLFHRFCVPIVLF
jgi:membrane protease YdiL (CAAX protease family)